MSRKVLIVVAATVLPGLAAGCSSSGNATTATTPPPRAVASSPSVASPPTSSAASTSSAPTGDLGGTWRGHYSGAYSGTFKLTWHESGANLSGNIHISTPDATLPINGTLTGNSISFGTVGSLAITYSGSVSGAAMSGTYRVNGGGPSSGGPWNATHV